MKKKLMLIINPQAGRCGYKHDFAEVMQTLSNGGYRTTVFFTEARGDATAFAALYAKDFDVIACIGGDGTLSEVVAGLMQVQDPPPLGYIPMGSTNDVANTLLLPKSAVECARRIVEGTPHAFDVGGFQEKDYFTYVAAFGAFTEVSYETPQNEKQALGHAAYFLQAAAYLPRLEAYNAKVEYEGGVIEGRFLYGSASNSVNVAGGVLKLDRQLVGLSDGMFEVMLVPVPKSAGHFSRLLHRIVSRDYDNDQVIMFQARELTVTFEKPVAWTRDGEDGGAHQVVHLVNHPSPISIIV